MAKNELWKFPKEILPDLKIAYLKEDFLWLVKQYNYYLIGEQLCPVCPSSVDKVKELLKPIFLADLEVLHREGKEADRTDLIELFAKYVSATTDPITLTKIPERTLRQTIVPFANEDLKARAVTERRRKALLGKVLKVSRNTFMLLYCDNC